MSEFEGYHKIYLTSEARRALLMSGEWPLFLNPTPLRDEWLVRADDRQFDKLVSEYGTESAAKAVEAERNLPGMGRHPRPINVKHEERRRTIYAYIPLFNFCAFGEKRGTKKLKYCAATERQVYNFIQDIIHIGRADVLNQISTLSAEFEFVFRSLGVRRERETLRIHIKKALRTTPALASTGRNTSN